MEKDNSLFIAVTTLFVPFTVISQENKQKKLIEQKEMVLQKKGIKAQNIRIDPEL